MRRVQVHRRIGWCRGLRRRWRHTFDLGRHRVRLPRPARRIDGRLRRRGGRRGPGGRRRGGGRTRSNRSRRTTRHRARPRRGAVGGADRTRLGRIAPRLRNDRAHVVVRDHARAGRCGAPLRLRRQRVDGARHAARGHVDLARGLARERVRAVASRRGHAVVQVEARVRLLHGLQPAAHRETLRDDIDITRDQFYTRSASARPRAPASC